MIIPSFGNFAPAPKLAESMLGGIESSQRDRAEANRVAIANQQINLQREKLQQEAVQSNMELAAKQKAHEDQMMRDNQEMLIKQQYQQNMIGLRQQQLERADEMVKLKATEVARKFQANQAYRAEAQAAIEGGETPEKAFSRSAMKFGPEMGLPGAAYTKLSQPEGGREIGSSFEIPGLNPEQFKGVQTSKGGVNVVRLPPNMDATGPAPAGYVRSGNRILAEREPIAVRNMRKEISELEKTQEKDVIGKFAVAKALKGDTLSPDRKRALAQYEAREKQINGLKTKLSGGGEDRKSEQPEKLGPGESIHKLKNGRRAVFKSKEFVRYAD